MALSLAPLAPAGAAATGDNVSGAQWLTPAGTPEGTRYSGLSQINHSNVGTLIEDFSVPTGAIGSHEGQPLVVGTTMYVVTPFPNTLIALDLANGGKTLWTYAPQVSSFALGVACCDVVNRGAAYASGLIVFETLDDSVVAVDAKTGALKWSTSLGDPHTGMTMTGAPLIVDNRVIVGNSGGEMGVRGWIEALSLSTGKPVWKAYNTGPDADVKIGSSFHAFYAKDQGANLGSTTWPGTFWTHGGATVWSWLTYDSELNLLFYCTSNPGVWNPDMRPGDNKWAATAFARNPDTGEAVWANQLTPHDGWDFDATSEYIAVDLPFQGVTRQLLVQFDKNGFAYTFDRTTGQVLVANPFEPVTWATGIDLTTGLPNLVASKQTHQGVWAYNICPTPLGGKDFEPAAYSPQSQLFYVPAINLCYNFQALKAMYIRGAPFMGADEQFVAGLGGANMGELVAWDAVKGARAWSIKEPLPLYGGVLATAGEIVFYGTLDNKFKAVDAYNGKTLFSTTLECGITSNPIAFTGADGKERIAVYSGIGWLAGRFAGGACPSETWNGGGGSGTGPTSGYVHVFRLP